LPGSWLHDEYEGISDDTDDMDDSETDDRLDIDDDTEDTDDTELSRLIDENDGRSHDAVDQTHDSSDSLCSEQELNEWE
jgi:hypothetical protein